MRRTPVLPWLMETLHSRQGSASDKQPIHFEMKRLDSSQSCIRRCIGIFMMSLKPFVRGEFARVGVPQPGQFGCWGSVERCLL
jgi:hypothetical protein